MKKAICHLITGRTSILVFPAIASMIFSCEVVRAIAMTHPRYGTRVSVISAAVTLLWGALFISDQRRVQNDNKRVHIEVPILPVIVIVFFVGTYMVCAVWGSGYLTLAPYERLDNGAQHIDTLFHSSIAESYKQSLSAKVLLNDEEHLVYHTFSHLLLGIISGLIGVPAYIAYNFLFPVLFLPVYLFSQIWAISQAKMFFENRRTITFLNVVVLVLFNVGVFYKDLLSSYGVWKSSYIVSESFLVANTIAFFSYASIFAFLARRRRKEKDNVLFCLGIIPVEIFFISWTKISVGLVFVVLIMYYIFRSHTKDIRFWMLNAYYSIDFLLCLRLFNSSGDDMGARIKSNFQWMAFGERCSGMLGIWGHYIILLIIPLAFIFLEIYMGKYTRNDFVKGRTVFVEGLIIAVVFAFLPSFIMVIPGGSAAYFSYAVEIPGLILLCGHNYIDLERDIKREVKHTIYAILTLICIWNSYTNRPLDPFELVTLEHNSNLSSQLLEIRDVANGRQKEYTIYIDSDSTPAQILGGKRACYVCPAMTGISVINATYIQDGICYTFLRDEVTGYGFNKTNNTHLISMDEAFVEASIIGKKHIIHMTNGGYEIIDLEK